MSKPKPLGSSSEKDLSGFEKEEVEVMENPRQVVIDVTEVELELDGACVVGKTRQKSKLISLLTPSLGNSQGGEGKLRR